MTKTRKSVKAKPTTYAATHKGKAVKVTVPDDLKSIPLEDALRDNLSPQAVAAIAAHLCAAKTNSASVNKEIHAFTRLLVHVVGGTDAYNSLMKELGL